MIYVYTTGDGVPYAAGDGTLLVVGESLGLIWDRTQADVYRVQQLRKKGWANMTENERTEFLSPLKGAYNFDDLNRVERAARQLADQLALLPQELRDYASDKQVHFGSGFDVPYEPTEIDTKTNWTVRDIPTPTDMSRYLGNVKTLRAMLDYATAALPDSMDKLTYTGANAIEEALEGLFVAIADFRLLKQGLIDNAAAAFLYSGEIYGGEV